jgi:hypothetical protein
MNYHDWDCSLYEYYVREAICADQWGGTPSQYDGKPERVGEPSPKITSCDKLPKPVSDDPKTPEDETVPLIRFGYEGNATCDDCRMCNAQYRGWVEDGAIKGASENWKELDHICPPKGKTDGQGNHDGEADLAMISAFCAGGGEPGLPTTGPKDDVPTPGIWICNGSPSICGTMTDTFGGVTMEKRCMAALVPDCVEANDEPGAKTACVDLCKDKDAQHAEEAAKSGGAKTWNPPFPCADLQGIAPAKAEDPATMCSGGGAMGFAAKLPAAAKEAHGVEQKHK